MTQHLVLPDFLRSDILADVYFDPDARQNVGTLVQKSVGAIQAEVPGITEEAAREALKDGLAALGVTDPAAQATIIKSMVTKTTTDPVVITQPYVQPTDFAAQYPQPLDPTEILEFCEEIAVWESLPEVVTPFNADSWREMDELEFDETGEANDGFFLRGGCPDTTVHDGDNMSQIRYHIGGQKTLSVEDIKHARAVASMQGLGISALSTDARRVAVAGLKEKEMKLQEILTINKWDLALVKGNHGLNSLAFNGIETQVTGAAGARTRTNTTGTFVVEEFDQFLTQGCAAPTHVYGHPMAIRAIKYAYMQLGAASNQTQILQVLITKDGNKIVPGYTLADQIDTAIGRITLVSDRRFTTVQAQPDRFHSTVYLLRLYHNGEPIVYKSTQTPLSFKDLTPGCTAISFMIYAATCLVIKHMCAQATYEASWPGRIGDGCEIVGGTSL